MVKFFRKEPAHDKNFGWALKVMKDGTYVSRRIWGGIYLRMMKENGTWSLYMCNVHINSCSQLTDLLTEDVLAEDWGVFINKIQKEVHVWPTTVSNSSSRKSNSRGSKPTA